MMYKVYECDFREWFDIGSWHRPQQLLRSNILETVHTFIEWFKAMFTILIFLVNTFLASHPIFTIGLLLLHNMNNKTKNIETYNKASKQNIMIRTHNLHIIT